MPTIKRNWYPGASYHITARGNHRSDIFKDEGDFNKYLSLMKEALEYFQYDNYEIICYCLMNNHVHLLIKTENKPIGNFIGRINSMYAKYYNKKHNYIGHLFQDRYYSELIKSDVQMLEVSRYIHLSPVRAKMIKTPGEYKWSSYNIYIGKQESKLILYGRILSYFNKERKVELYREFIESATPGV
ncbi:transposase [Clostridium sp. BSD9I1]|uniref:transposase n=1 Tax=Clostridium sp. BSD9I1 TaxID=2003589 RepID=UPI0016454C2A|nr:transposase [Clostridium sp. BSD9I1]